MRHLRSTEGTIQAAAVEREENTSRYYRIDAPPAYWSDDAGGLPFRCRVQPWLIGAGAAKAGRKRGARNDGARNDGARNDGARSDGGRNMVSSLIAAPDVGAQRSEIDRRLAGYEVDE